MEKYATQKSASAIYQAKKQAAAVINAKWDYRVEWPAAVKLAKEKTVTYVLAQQLTAAKQEIVKIGQQVLTGTVKQVLYAADLLANRVKKGIEEMSTLIYRAMEGDLKDYAYWTAWRMTGILRLSLYANVTDAGEMINIAKSHPIIDWDKQRATWRAVRS
jgi:hypothetical protein